jgi:hypothetical protein
MIDPAFDSAEGNDLLELKGQWRRFGGHEAIAR